MGRGDPEGADQTARGHSRRFDRVQLTSGLTPQADIIADHRHVSKVHISGREQCDPGQSILVAPIAGRYDEAGDRDRVAIAGARWDL